MNILIFGPNGSGKGTQGSLAKKKYDLDHIESGAIFRKHIGGGTELGKKAKEFIDRGELVLQMAHRLRVAFAGRRCGGVLGLPRIAGFPEAAWFGGVLAFLGVPAEPAGLAEDVIVAVEIMF